MFLSNPSRIFLLTLICATFLTGCGSSTEGPGKQVSSTDERQNQFPFPSVEPAVYQGDFFMNDGSRESHWFIARKGDKYRIDLFHTELWRSEIINDKVYSIDHKKRLYQEMPGPGSAPSETTIGNVTSTFFGPREYREFEDLGVEGNLRKYRVRPLTGSRDEIFIYIDQPSGLIVRQEFTVGGENGPAGSSRFEIRNLKLEVDDSVFAVPAGYTHVSADDFARRQSQTK